MLIAALAILAAGACLRLTGLDEQIVTGDERHAVRACVNPFAELLSRFEKPDPCMPITAWCRVLLLTIGLGEWGLRLLAFVPGIVLLWVCFRGSTRLLAAPDRLLLALVLAGSPLLVMWSRMGRPYAAISLLGVLAILTLLRHAGSGGKGVLVAAASCQVLLFWFSPTTVPFLLGLFLAGAYHGLRFPGPGASVGARLRRSVVISGPALLAAAAALVLFAPALPSLLELGSTSDARQSVTSLTFLESARILYGFPRVASGVEGFLWIAPVTLTVLGMIRFLVRHPSLRLATLLVLLLPGLMYALTGFDGIHIGRTLVRYQATTVPLFLFLEVYGFAGLAGACSRWTPHWGVALRATAFALSLLHMVVGPLTTGLPPQHPFGLLYSPLCDADPILSPAAVERIPSFYREHCGETSAVFIEWYSHGPLDDMLARYQEVHGGRVVRWSHRLDKDGPGFELRTLRIGLSAVSRQGEPAYVVVHHHPAEEVLYVEHGRRPAVLGKAPKKSHLVQATLKRCEREFGPAIHADDWISVFRRS